MATAERDYYELLGVERDGDATPRSRRRSASSRASSTPTSRRSPTPQARFRAVAEAYEVLSNAEPRQLYDRYGHAGLRRGGYAPSDFDFGNLCDIFSAFFGDDLFGAQPRRPGAAAGTSAPRSRSSSPTPLTGVSGRRGRGRGRVRALRGRRRRAGHGAGHVPTLRRPRPAAAGLAQRLRRVRPHAGLPDAAAARARSSRRRARSATARAARSRSGARGRDPGRDPDGQRIRIRARATPARRAGPPATPTSRCTSSRDARFERDGDDILSRRPDDVQAARGATVTVPTLDGDVELEFEPGTQPGEVRVLRGKGMPSLQRRAAAATTGARQRRRPAAA